MPGALLFALGLSIAATPAMSADPSPATQALWRALEVKDREAATRALHEGAEVDAADLIGTTALHKVVVFWGDAELLQQILRAGARLEARNGTGQTPLVAALRHAHYTTGDPASAGGATLRAVIATLLDRGADAKGVDDRGRSLVAAAIELKDVVLVDRLLAAGAPLPDDALHLVLGASGSEPAVLRRVIEIASPAQIDARDAHGTTLAHRFASSAQTLPALEWLAARRPALLQTRADDGRLPMHDAALRANVDGLRWLAARGADINAVTHDGSSVLHMAAVGGDPATLAWMIEQKPDLSLRDRTGLRAVDRYVESHGFAVTPAEYKLGRVRALGGGEAEVARGRDANSPLHAAIGRRDLKAVRALLDGGADANVIDGNGYSALSRALSLSIRSLNVREDARFGEKLLALLMEHGADPTRRVPASGRSLLEDADALGRREEIERLMRRSSR